MTKEEKKTVAVFETVSKIAKYMDSYTYGVVREEMFAVLNKLYESGFDAGENSALEDLSTKSDAKA